MTELAKTQVLTKDGLITATVLDVVSPDRLYLMLLRGSIAAKYAGVVDGTALVPRAVKDLVVFPYVVG